jgi:hypothetical protein
MSQQALKIGPADLAALVFRARDALDHAVSKLEGRPLGEGETIRITLTTTVVKNPQDTLAFGPMEGLAQHV